MSTYIVLIKYTLKGIANIKESPARLDTLKEAARKMGAEVKAAYLLMGHYDGLIIFEAPDDQTMAQILLATGMQGNVSTETLKAFNEAEFRAVISGLA